MASAHTAVLVRVAHGLYRRWDRLASAERTRLADLAAEVKRLALDLRGHLDAQAAHAELEDANRRLADAIAESAARDPGAAQAEVTQLKSELSRELERAAQRHRAA
jgi:hypothetical protein